MRDAIDELDELDPSSPLGWLRDYIRSGERDEGKKSEALARLSQVVCDDLDGRVLYIEGYDETLMGPPSCKPTARQWLHRYVAGDVVGPKSFNEKAHEQIEIALAEAREEGRSQRAREDLGEAPFGWKEEASSRVWRETTTGKRVLLAPPTSRLQNEIWAFVLPQHMGHALDLTQIATRTMDQVLVEVERREVARPNATDDRTCEALSKSLPLEGEDVSHWAWNHCWSLYTKAGREVATIWPCREGYRWHTWDEHGIGGENASGTDLDDVAREVIASVKYQSFDKDPEDEAEVLADRVEELEAEVERLRKVINTPAIEDWIEAVPLEAAHQIERWGSEHDAGKTPADWFWLLGYLGGKALNAAVLGDIEKAKHHTISAGAALLNWHRTMSGGNSAMRPGILPPEGF